MKTMIHPTLWQEARERVETYLLSYGMGRGAAMSALIERILAVAAERQQQEPWRDAVSLAAAEAERVLRERMQPYAQNAGGMSAHSFARARAALHLARHSDARAPHFLDEQAGASHYSPAASAEMAALQNGPEVRFSNMVPEPMHYDVVADVANETWRAFARWPMIRSGLNVVLAVTGLSSVFYLTNF